MNSNGKIKHQATFFSYTPCDCKEFQKIHSFDLSMPTETISFCNPESQAAKLLLINFYKINI